MLKDESPYSQEFKDGAYKLGKYDYFPIGGVRASTELDDLKLEDAYLIDPTEKNPEKHLQWIVENSISLVAPVKNGDDWDKYGFATYRVFGLNRKSLVEERTALMLQVKSELVRARRWLVKAAAMDGGMDRSFMIDEAILIINSVKEKSLPSNPYSMMVKSLLEQDLSELMNEFRATLG